MDRFPVYFGTIWELIVLSSPAYVAKVFDVILVLQKDGVSLFWVETIIIELVIDVGTS